MKILLLGKNGQVGWELQRSLSPLGDVVALGSRADQNPNGLCGELSDLDGLSATIRHMKPNIVVNAAAYTAVDKAEGDEVMAHIVNADAPASIADECNRLGACMVHFSTDYVFDGASDTPWKEGDPTNPLSVYGQSKLEGEKAIIASCSRHIILRTSWVYGRHGQNFIKTILRLASERTSLSVIDDQWGAPTGSELLADVVAQMIPELVSSDNKAGIYHCAASGVTNWHGYARYIVETASSLGQALSIGADAIEAIPASQYKTAAKRPLNSRLDCSSLERTFSLTLPHWQLGVARVISEIASP